MSRIAVFAIDPRAKRLVVPTRRFVRRLFRLLKLKNSAVEIYLVRDAIMRKNVLAYPASRAFPRPDLQKGMRSLGEVYLNLQRIRETGEDMEYMAIHGILHLRGYSHAKKRDRIRMENRERILLRRMKTL